MKIYAKLLLSAVLILPLLLTSVVRAQNVDRGDGQPGRLQERLEARKERLKERLTSDQQNLVRMRCKSAQGRLKAFQERVNDRVGDRVTRYNDIVTKLSNLSVKLKARDIDTTALDERIAELKTKAEAFSKHYDEYKQQVDDLVQMDCESDPEAFKATIVAARAKRIELVRAAQDFRTFLTVQIKPALLTIRESMATPNNNPEAGGAR